MKNRISRLLLMLLALALTIGLCVFAVAATEEEQEQTVSATIIEVNPLFADDVVKARLDGNQPLLGAASYFYTDFNAFLNEARAQAVARNGYYQLGFKSTANLDETLLDSVVAGIHKHTGVANEGDYIRWNAHDWQMSWERPNQPVNGYYEYTITIDYTFLTTSTQEQEVTIAVNNLLNNLNVRNASDYQKIKTVYDYICKNIVYDLNGLEMGLTYCHSTHSAIIAEKTVCQGYASLFYRLMLEMGVNTRLVAGDASDYATPNYYDDDHGWNIVKLGSQWYNLDSTWDAELHPDGNNYQYFLVCDANFPEHTPWDEYMTDGFRNNYPKATSDYVPAGEWILINGKWHYQKNGVDALGWQDIGGKWYFFNGNGEMMTGWVQIAGKYYYFHSDGVMYKGWLHFGNTYYYLRNDGSMATGWVQIAGKYYYFHSDGIMYRGWLHFGNTYYYLRNDGSMATGIITINGVQHIFDANGVWQGEVQQQKNGWVQQNGQWYYYQNGKAVTGWLKSGGLWYYFNSNGTMKTGWLQQGSIWYYFKADGSMATGTITIGGKQNKFDANGVWQGEVQQQKNGWVQQNGQWYFYQNGKAVTGWLKSGGLWYYFNSNGTMKTGWLQQGSIWYYFKADGSMATGTITIGGKQNKFDANGVWQGEVQQQQNGWVQQNGKWYYYQNGEKVTSWKSIGSYTYYFGSDGVMRTGWVQFLGDWYYMDQNGAMQMAWQYIGGKTYYFDHFSGAMWHDIWIKDPEGNIYFSCSDGYIYENGWYWIDGYQYYFDANGFCQNPPNLTFT